MTTRKEDLRRRAEERLEQPPTAVSEMSPREIESLVYELRVHQVELEMQNEELVAARVAETHARDWYTDLFESAPMGYLILDWNQTIREANTAAQELLGRTRAELLGTKLYSLTGREEADDWYRIMRRAGASRQPTTGEIRVRRADGEAVLRLHATLIQEPETKDQEWRVGVSDITTEKRAQQALESSEQRYRFLFEESQMVNVIVGFDQSIIDVNKQGLRNLGYVKEEVIGQPLTNFVVSEQRDSIAKRLREVLDGRKAQQLDVEIHAKDGSVRTFMTSPGSAALKREGKPYGMLLSATDITPRRRLEQQLHRERELLRAIIDTIPVMITIYDPKLTEFQFNAAIERIAGWTREDARRHDILERIYPDSEYRKEICDYMESLAPGWKDIVMTARDGSKLETTWANVRIPDGRRVGIGIDVSERKRMERELEDARRALENTVHEQRKEIHYTRDELSTRQQALEAVYAMGTAFGVSLESLLDQVCLTVADIMKLPFVTVLRNRDSRTVSVVQVQKGDLEHPGREIVECPLLDRLHSTRAPVQEQGELSELRPLCPCFGEGDYHSYAGIPILSGEAEPLGAICSFKSAEEPFNEFEIHLLEIFARYLAHELSRVEMEESLRHASELELLGRLTSGVAHEVRNPLNAIQALVEAMGAEMEEDEAFGIYKQHLSKQVDRLTALMEDLLMLGRPVREEDKEAITVGGLVSDAVAACYPMGQGKEREMEISLPEEAKTAKVNGVRLKLQQVLVNLLQNARQHSPDDQPVTLAIDLARGSNVRIRIIDRGPGIDSESLPRVFEPFYTTRKAGTGLGLSIVHRLVVLHGGDIKLYNNDPGPGLTAEVWLPMLGG